jgi:hypothetical protein
LKLAECPNGTRFHAMYFPASGASQKQPHCRFVREVQPRCPLLDEISDPLHSPKSYVGEQGGQMIGPSRPIHLFGKVLFRDSLTVMSQFGPAPSCWKETFGWMWPGVKCAQSHDVKLNNKLIDWLVECVPSAGLQTASISRYFVLFTVGPSKKEGAVASWRERAHHTFNLKLSRSYSRIACGR